VTINTSGAPGSGSQIRIRGGSSFASNDPLIVIDGLPIENNSDKKTGSTSILASLNPSTIESMTVLKMLLLPQFTVRVRLMVLLSLQKGRKTLAVDYNFQYGSELVKTTDLMLRFPSNYCRKTCRCIKIRNC
jgi:iron complex outermembrane receptor protein